MEVYPAAALRRWGLTHRGYKGRLAQHADLLRELVTILLSQTSRWLVVSHDDRERLERSDHLLDGLVSAPGRPYR